MEKSVSSNAVAFSTSTDVMVESGGASGRKRDSNWSSCERLPWISTLTPSDVL